MSARRKSPDSVLRRVIRLPLWGFSLFIALSGLSLTFFLRPAFIDMEKGYSEQLIQQIYTALDFILQDTRVIAAAWANRDDLAEGVANWTPQVQQRVFPDEVFARAELDLLVVAGLDGTPRFSRCRREGGSPPGGQPFTPDPALQKILRDHPGTHREGVVQSSLGPLFLVVNPIRKNDPGASACGTLTVGRRIGPRLFRKVYEVLHREVKIAPDPPAASTPERRRPNVEITRDLLVMTYPLRGLDGQPAVCLRTEVERTLFFVIFNSTLAYFLFLIISFALILLFLVWTFQRRILRRILGLSNLLDANATRGPRLLECPEDGDDEITSLQRNYNQMIRKIRSEQQRRSDVENRMILMAKLTAAGKVTAGIVHEINNPVRVIKNCLYALEMDPGSPERYVELLKSEIRHLGDITDRLTQLSRVEADDAVEFELNDVLDDTVAALETGFLEGTDCRIRMLKAHTPVRMQGNPSRVRQVFFNIIKNAAEAMGFRGVVTVEVVPRDGEVTVKVLDEGPGVDPAKLETMFYPFSSDKEKGMGVGLSIACTIVHSYGGQIWVDPEYKNGACFVVSLPVLERGEKP